MNAFVRISMLGLLAMPLAAQSSGFSIGAGVIQGFDSLRKVTNNDSGFAVNASYDTVIYGSEIPARIGVAYAIMPGKTYNYSETVSVTDPVNPNNKVPVTSAGSFKTSLNLVQITGDLLVDTRLQGLKGVFGISFNGYTVKREGAEEGGSNFAAIPAVHFPLLEAKGVKLGVRLGIDYSFNKAVSGELLFQQTELAGADTNDSLVRRGGLNPAWVQLGVRYHF